MGYYVDVHLKFRFKENVDKKVIERLNEWGIVCELRTLAIDHYSGKEYKGYFVDCTPDNPKWWYSFGDFVNEFGPHIKSKVLGTYQTEDCEENYTYIINPYRDEDIMQECHSLRALSHRGLVLNVK